MSKIYLSINIVSYLKEHLETKNSDETIKHLKNFIIKFDGQILYKSVLMKNVNLDSKNAQLVLDTLTRNNQLKRVYTIKVLNVELDPEVEVYTIKEIPKAVYDTEGNSYLVNEDNIFMYYKVVK